MDCATTTADNDFQIIRISTDDILERDRVEYVREVYGRTIIKHEIEPPADSPLHMRGALCKLPGLGLALVAGSRARLYRTPVHIGSDDLVLNVTLAGGRILRQLGREVVVGEGEAVLSTSAEAGMCDIYADSRWLSIRMPLNALAPMITDLDSVLVRPIPAGTEPLCLLVNYIGALQDSHALSQSELHRVIVTHVNELVALTVGATVDAAEITRGQGLRSARLIKILQMIEAQISDAGLSAVTVASHLGVTPRYVNLLLEETGRTFSQHVLEKRLAKATALLRDPRIRRRKIAAIAFEAGFTDLSHFNRAFRRRFGDTPSAMRANAAHAEERQ